MLNDESDDDESESGSSGTYSFPTFYFYFDDSVGHVSSLGSVVFVLTGFESKFDIFSCRVCIKRSQIQRWSNHRNILALKFLVLFPNLKFIFIVVVMIRLFCTHSYRCCFTKNMILRAPMGSICMPLDSVSGGTDVTAFIQCVDGREPQIHELWYLGLDVIVREVHPTA